MVEKTGDLVHGPSELVIDLKLGSLIPEDGILSFQFPQKLIFENGDERPICHISRFGTDTKVDCDSFIYVEDSSLFGIREIRILNLCKSVFN